MSESLAGSAFEVAIGHASLRRAVEKIPPPLESSRIVASPASGTVVTAVARLLDVDMKNQFLIANSTTTLQIAPGFLPFTPPEDGKRSASHYD
jgi:hypothetical protein